MEPRKQAIMSALDAFVAQRPGLEYGNYGDPVSYRAEQRSITKDRHHYEQLARYVERRDDITADALLEAARSAYSGRLTIIPPGPHDHGGSHTSSSPDWRIDYTTGQYFPTEYRRAACAVLASAIWAYLRSTMPAPSGRVTRTHGPFTTEHDSINGMTPGDWLRQAARHQFGRHIGSRWFS